MPAIAFDRSIVLRRVSTVFPEIGNSRAGFEIPRSGRPRFSDILSGTKIGIGATHRSFICVTYVPRNGSPLRNQRSWAITVLCAFTCARNFGRLNGIVQRVRATSGGPNVVLATLFVTFQIFQKDWHRIQNGNSSSHTFFGPEELLRWTASSGVARPGT